MDIFVFYGLDRRFKRAFPTRSRFLVFRTGKSVDCVVKGLGSRLSGKNVSCTDSFLRNLLVCYARANEIKVVPFHNISLEQADIAVDRDSDKFVVRDIGKSIKAERERTVEAFV